LQQGGMSAGKSQAYGVALAVGDLTGVTELAEATEGFDIDEKRELDGWERAQKAANGTAAAAGTAAGVMSMTSRVATAVKPVSAADDLASAGASKADDAARAGANSGLCLAEFVPREQVVQSNGRVDAKKPAYHDPGTHQPGTAQKLGKEIIPDNAEALYKRAVPDPSSVQSNGYAKRWYAKDADGNLHRFQMDEVGKAHWNGSERDIPTNHRPLERNKIDLDVKRRLGC